ncbi:MAG: hypothetical protein ACYTHM_00775 [Planctomycetota bacterium]|jgi:hypothetical protein
MIHLIVGLIALILGAWGIISWWGDFGQFLRGMIPLLLVVVGLAGIGAGFQKKLREADLEEEDAEDEDEDTIFDMNED